MTPSNWNVSIQALCVGNSPVTGEFPSQRPVTQSFDIFFELHLNIRLSKQSRRRWFETPLRSLWRHSNVTRVIVLQGFRIALGQSCDCSNASEVTQEEACKLTTSWWRHQMETFSAFPAFCAGISPVTGEFPTKRAVTRSFEAFFDLRLIRQLSKQWRHRWFETPSHWSWRRFNVNQIITDDIITTIVTRKICTPAFWEYTPMSRDYHLCTMSLIWQYKMPSPANSLQPQLLFTIKSLI